MNISFVGELESTSPETIPESAAKEIWSRSGWYTTGPRLIPTEFNHLFRVATGEIDTYIAEQTKQYSTIDHIESITHLIDVNSDQEIVGIGELRYSLTDKSPFFLKKPFVGWTYTEEHNRRNGLGLRRLSIMNMAALAIHELPLHSSTLISDEEIAVWEKLVRIGTAIKYTEMDTREPEGRDRYSFVR